MASKKTGRLAGLAALAGAAYLADKKGMFGGKGEGKVAPDRDDADRYTGSRTSKEDAAVEEGESAQAKFRKKELDDGDIAAMAPRKVAPVKTTTAAPATQRFAPAGSPVLSSGAGSGGPRTIGLGRSSGRGGAEAGEEATYNAEKRAQALKDFSAKRPGIMARMREKDKEMFKNIKPAVETEREPAPDLASAYSGADTYKRGGAVKKMASGGMTSSASKRGDGIATKGKTRGKMC